MPPLLMDFILVGDCVDLLGTEFVKRLLSTVCAFLCSKAREVVRSTLELIKVTVGVLPPDELASHLEQLVGFFFMQIFCGNKNVCRLCHIYT